MPDDPKMTQEQRRYFNEQYQRQRMVASDTGAAWNSSYGMEPELTRTPRPIDVEDLRRLVSLQMSQRQAEMRFYEIFDEIFEPFSHPQRVQRLRKEKLGRSTHRPSPHAVECNVSEATLLRLLDKES